MLGTEVQPAVVVVVTEVPRLPRRNALTTARAVLESRLHPRTEHSAAHAMRGAVSACLPRFRPRSQSSSHVALNPTRAVEIGGETYPLRVEGLVVRQKTRCRARGRRNATGDLASARRRTAYRRCSCSRSLLHLLGPLEVFPDRQSGLCRHRAILGTRTLDELLVGRRDQRTRRSRPVQR